MRAAAEIVLQFVWQKRVLFYSMSNRWEKYWCDEAVSHGTGWKTGEVW